MHTSVLSRSMPNQFQRSSVVLLGMLSVALLAQVWSQALPTGSLIDTAGDRLKLPLQFTPNVGHSDPTVKMTARGMSGTLAFTDRQVVLALPSAGNRNQGSDTREAPSQAPTPTVVRLQFDGAHLTPTIVGGEPLGVMHSYVGNDPTRWRSNVPAYASLTYHALYPGIDLRYDGYDGGLKGTYLVAPRVDPAQIGWRYNGAQTVEIDAKTGDLHITLPNGMTLIEQAPVAWQELMVSGQRVRRVPVEVRFAKSADGRIGFALGHYDQMQPLTIDPTLVYSTYLGGGSADYAHAVAVDKNGNVYVTGHTYSANFPGASGPRLGSTDVFVTKLNAQGSRLLYTTILAGEDDEESNSIVVDSIGNIWIAGGTQSNQFPTRNPIKGTFSGGNRDTFATKLAPDGVLTASTYLGEEWDDLAYGIAVDQGGNPYLVGHVEVSGPVAFVRRLTADGGTQVYQAFFGQADQGFNRGTSARAVAVDAQGNSYITGQTDAVFNTVNGYKPACPQTNPGYCDDKEAFVFKVNPEGTRALYSTYLGGDDGGSGTGSGSDIGTGIALDNDGNILVTGYTLSPNFPTKNAAQATKRGADNFADAFVTKFTPQGNALVYSTYLGGAGWEQSQGIVVDRAGNAHVAGFTGSEDFPVTADAAQPMIGRGICIVGSTERFCYDGFVTTLSATGSRVWSTYLGGKNDDLINGIALDDAANLLLAGKTESFDFPTTTGVLQPNKALNDDAFVVKSRTGSGSTNPVLPYKVYLPMTTR